MTVKSTPRVGIRHFSDITDSEFATLATWLRDGRDISRFVDFSLKIDGAGMRFGVDGNNQMFVETSRSGPIYKRGAFSEHANSKGFRGERLYRAESYDTILSYLFHLLGNIPLQFNSFKVVGEILYSDWAVFTPERDYFKFVTVPYYIPACGVKFTFAIFDVVNAETGLSLGPIAKKQIMKYLMNHMYAEQYKFIDPTLHDRGLYFSDEDLLNAKNFGRKILSHEFSDKYMLGKYIEGIVMKTPVGVFKVNTNRY